MATIVLIWEEKEEEKEGRERERLFKRIKRTKNHIDINKRKEEKKRKET